MRLLIRCALIVLLMLIATPSGLFAEDGRWQKPTDGTVYDIAISQDGDLIVVGTQTGKIIAYNAVGDELWNFTARNTVTGVALSADGKYIAASSHDRRVYLFDRSGKVLLEKQLGSLLNDVAIGQRLERILVASQNGSVILLDQAGNTLWEAELFGVPQVVTMSADGRALASGGADSKVILYDESGDKVQQWAARNVITGLSMSANGSVLGVSSEDGKLYVLDGSGQPLWDFAGTDKLLSVTVSSDGRLIGAGSRDQKVYLLNSEGAVVWQSTTGAAVHALALSANGRTLAVGTEAPEVRVLDVAQTVAAAEASQTRIQVFLAALIVALLTGGAGYLLYARSTPARREREGVRVRAITGPIRAFWRGRLSYAFILPSLLLLITFSYIPAFSAVYHSFTEWSPGAYTKWVGLENFARMPQDQYLLIGIPNLLILLLTNFAKTLTVPLIVAELIFYLHSRAAQYWYRTVFVIPLVVPSVAVLLIWMNIYDPNLGLANQLLRASGMSELTHSWLGEPRTALGAIIFMGFPWVGTLALLIYYAGLISIPSEIFDAASVDGASIFRRILAIDLPMLLGQIKLLLILTFIGTMQEFTRILIMTEGGPLDSTYVPGLEVYFQAVRFGRYGYASAIGLVLFLIILLATIIQMKFVRSSTEYQA